MLCLGLLSLLACSTQFRGAVLAWDGSASGYWGTGANWNSGTVPQDGDDLVFLVFPAGPTRLTTTNNLSSSRRFDSITISGAAYPLRGNAFAVSNGISATAPAAMVVVHNDITYSGVTRVNVGTLELNKEGVNAMAGNLIVGNGVGIDTVRWLYGNQLPSSTEVLVNEGALLDLNNFSDVLGLLTLNGGDVVTGSGVLTLAANVEATAVLDDNAGDAAAQRMVITHTEEPLGDRHQSTKSRARR